MNIVFAPHLDDEIIGCYSVLQDIDLIVYFTKDYREESLQAVKNKRKFFGKVVTYMHFDSWDKQTTEEDIIYLPSKYDYHPEHKKVRNIGLSFLGKKMFYSVEMNVPWLEEEIDPTTKEEVFDLYYPAESMLNDKYWLFKSIKSYDDIIFASIKLQFEQFHCWPNAPEEVGFLRAKHRHIFHLTVNIQQFQDDRDIEYFLFQREVQELKDTIEWKENTSCEMFSIQLKRKLEVKYPNREIQVSLFEDGENGAIIT